MRYIAFLRGINVGVGRSVKNEALNELFRSMGFDDIVIYRQSGNIVFGSGKVLGSKLVAKLESRLKKTAGFPIDVIIRDSGEMRKIVEANPFSSDKAKIEKLHMTFLKSASKGGKLILSRSGKEEYSVVGKEIYLYCPAGYGRTKMNNQVIERKSGVSATTKNWKTVMAVAGILKTP